MRKQHAGPRRGEHGAALLVVMVVLMVVLVGGMAAIAVTSGQLSRSRGFRARSATDACAGAALARLRARYPDVGATDFESTRGQLTLVGANAVEYRSGHYGDDNYGTATFYELAGSQFDATGLWAGRNITNSLGTDLTQGARLVRMSTVCGGSGQGESEVETIFTFEMGGP